MKTFSVIALALCIAYISAAATSSCLKANFCMGCSNTVDNKCTACFNYGSKAKIWSANKCLVSRATSQVSNCLIYNSNSTTDVAASGTCQNCSGGKVIVETKSATNVWSTVCSSSSTTKPSLTPFKCQSGSTRYTTTAAGATTYTASCMMCQKKYQPTGAAASVFSTCVTAISIANCSVGGVAVATINCMYCNSKYAVNDGNTCTAFTADSNCKQMNTASTCKVCWWAYIFDGTKCVKAASIISVAFFGLVALLN